MNKVFASVAALAILFTAGTAFAQSYPYPTYGTYGNTYYQQPTTVAYPSLNCVVITRDLSYGSRGTDVRSLQSFLVSLNYPGSGSWMISGYFGRATRAAVQGYQSSHNLYPSGIVDANTRGAILSSCGYSNPTYPSYPTYPTYPTQTYPTYPTYPSSCGTNSYNYNYVTTNQYWNCPTSNSNVSISYLSPSTGAIGTVVTVTGIGFSYSGNTVRFGNGIISNVNSFNGTSLSFTVPSYLSGYGSQTVTNGTYNVSVSNASGETSNTMQFNVQGSNTYQAPTISSVSGPTSLGTNTTGTWTISFYNPTSSYVTTSVNWGDTGYGYVNAAAPQTSYQQGQSTQTFTHAYQNSGTYTVTFTVANQNGGQNTSSATVVVSGSGTNQTLTVTPQYGNAPLYSSFTMYFQGCNGGNYYLYYGDGTSDFIAVPADLCNSTRSVSHTYTQNGTFTASLRTSNQSNTLATATVTVGSGSNSTTLTATPTYGTKPLTVVFSANPGGAAYSGGAVIVFGDGSAGTFCTPNESCSQRTTSHVYTTAGTYYATLQSSNYGSTQNLGTATITVNN